jgi:hypothetical protein
MTKPQNQNIRIAILKHKLRNGKLITKQTKSIHPDKMSGAISKSEFATANGAGIVN